jgi:hypothetical protein
MYGRCKHERNRESSQFDVLLSTEVGRAAGRSCGDSLIEQLGAGLRDASIAF